MICCAEHTGQPLLADVYLCCKRGQNSCLHMYQLLEPNHAHV